MGDMGLRMCQPKELELEQRYIYGKSSPGRYQLLYFYCQLLSDSITYFPPLSATIS